MVGGAGSVGKRASDALAVMPARSHRSTSRSEARGGVATDTGDASAAFIVAVFLMVSFVYLLRDDVRPHSFDTLFALAALLGAVGYVFGLFDGGVPYDKPVHAFTI